MEQANNNAEQYFEEKLARLRSGLALRVVDLFSGCGGMSLGLQRAGYTFLGGVENNQQAINTYSRNLFKSAGQKAIEFHSIPHDITTFTPREFLREVLQKEHPENLVDVIVGGPPCQAFSRIGRAKLRALRQNSETYRGDERSNLYLQYLKYVEFFRPLVVLMENVPEIMNYEGKNVAEEIAFSLEEMGYSCCYTILNTAFYGVPQLRQRFYLIAYLSVLDIKPSFPEPSHFIQLPSGYELSHSIALTAITQNLFDKVRYISPPQAANDLPPAVTVHDALSDLPPIDTAIEGVIRRGVRNFGMIARYIQNTTPSSYAYTMRSWTGFESYGEVWNHITRFHPRDHPIFQLMQYDDQYPQAHQIALKIFQEKLEEYEKEHGVKLTEDSDVYKDLLRKTVPPYDATKFPNKWWKLNPGQPSRTLTAHMGKDTYSHIHYATDQARVISVREAARLQSFPDGFQFPDAMNGSFAQIGNAVAPLQSYALGKHIKQNLIEVAQQKYEVECSQEVKQTVE